MLNLMKKMNGASCPCGKTHKFDSEIYSRKGAIKNLKEALSKLEAKKLYVFADQNTYSVGGRKVEDIINEMGLPYSLFIYPDSPKPDERGLGDAVIHCPADADTVIAIAMSKVSSLSLTSRICQLFETVIPFPMLRILSRLLYHVQPWSPNSKNL